VKKVVRVVLNMLTVQIPLVHLTVVVILDILVMVMNVPTPMNVNVVITVIKTQNVTTLRVVSPANANPDSAVMAQCVS
jgi:hypothetical protein